MLCTCAIVASQRTKSDEIADAFGNDNGTCYDIQQLMVVYSMTNAFLPTRSQPAWLVDDFFGTEKICADAMGLALKELSRLWRDAGVESNRLAKSRAVDYEAKLRRLESEYWRSRAKLAREHLGKLTELVQRTP